MTNNNVSIHALPGTMCTEALWSPLQKHLKSSEIVHHALPIASDISTMVEQLSTTLPKEPFHLLGFSLGGYIACSFALKHPERIKSLCILANSPLSLPHQEVIQRRHLIRWVEKHGYPGLSPSKIKSMIHPTHAKRQDIFDLMIGMDKALGEKTLINQLSATTEREDLTTRLATQDFPIIFIHGDHDALVKPDKISHISQSNPNILHKIINQSGHMLPIEQSEACGKNVDHWVTQNER